MLPRLGLEAQLCCFVMLLKGGAPSGLSRPQRRFWSNLLQALNAPGRQTGVARPYESVRKNAICSKVTQGDPGIAVEKRAYMDLNAFSIWGWLLYRSSTDDNRTKL
jgi:hypothetical protein